jgi:toxin ParE1/3/4
LGKIGPHIEWTLSAIGDLRQAGEFISLDNPDAALRMAERVKEAIEALTDFPHIGRPGRVPNTKELVISGTPFIATYRVKQGAVQILRILHHSRKWPSHN